MVLDNGKEGFIGDNSSGASKHGLLVISCRFGLNSRDCDHSPSVHFLGDGASGFCHRHPTYKLPIVDSIFFSSIELKNGCWPTFYCM
jgi:hypothetical protein